MISESCDTICIFNSLGRWKKMSIKYPHERVCDYSLA